MAQRDEAVVAASADRGVSGIPAELAEARATIDNIDAALIHEAAIGKIAGDQILKLRTFGLTEEQAEEKIIQGFLHG